MQLSPDRVVEVVVATVVDVVVEPLPCVVVVVVVSSGLLQHWSLQQPYEHCQSCAQE